MSEQIEHIPTPRRCHVALARTDTRNGAIVAQPTPNTALTRTLTGISLERPSNRPTSRNPGHITMSNSRHQPRASRRQFLAALGLSAGAALVSQVVSAPADAATTRLHGDVAQRGQGKLYSGSANKPGCDTAASSDCPGPGRLSAYWGGLYVHSTASNMLRTGPYAGCGATFPGNGNTSRMRWASTSGWAPEYRFAGRIWVYDVSARPDPWSGLVFHPVHISNCNNYWIRIWDGELIRQLDASLRGQVPWSGVSRSARDSSLLLGAECW